jgi:hypothetical protein
MKSKIIFSALACMFFFAGCKKDNTTPGYSNLLKGTEWYGEYTNKGTNDLIGYAISFNNDSTFKMYRLGDDGLAGYWSVDANKTVSMRFATGSQNKWTANIANGDTDLINISIPTPDNFSFVSNAKKIGDPPSDVFGHTWSDGGVGRISFLNTGLKYFSAPENYPYTGSTPLKNKIFKTIVGFFIVDGKIAWQYFGSTVKKRWLY